MFSRMGAGGLQAIKDMQLQRGERLTPELRESLNVIHAVPGTNPHGSLSYGSAAMAEFEQRVMLLGRVGERLWWFPFGVVGSLSGPAKLHRSSSQSQTA